MYYIKRLFNRFILMLSACSKSYFIHFTLNRNNLPSKQKFFDVMMMMIFLLIIFHFNAWKDLTNRMLLQKTIENRRSKPILMFHIFTSKYFIVNCLDTLNIYKIVAYICYFKSLQIKSNVLAKDKWHSSKHMIPCSYNLLTKHVIWIAPKSMSMLIWINLMNERK